MVKMNDRFRIRNLEWRVVNYDDTTGMWICRERFSTELTYFSAEVIELNKI